MGKGIGEIPQQVENWGCGPKLHCLQERNRLACYLACQPFFVAFLNAEIIARLAKVSCRSTKIIIALCADAVYN